MRIRTWWPRRGHLRLCVNPYQQLRVAASASFASWPTTSKNAEGWPMNSPSAVKAWTAATAPEMLVKIETGRMIDTFGKFPLRNEQGSGMIKLVLKSSPPKGGELRSGNVRLPNVTLKGGVNTLPALSDQVWKCMVSVGPMLSRIRRTTGSVTLRASVG